MSINKNEELLPYYERARGTLEYDPKTGIFTRFVKKSGLYKEAGGVGSRGYRRISIRLNGKRRRLSAHRLAWFMVHGELPNVIDHIDGDKLNNAIKNLRSCNQHQNMQNTGKRSDNTSGYKGVSWSKTNKKWVSLIRYDGKQVYLGVFNCPKEASEVYQSKAKELFGEYYNSIN